MLFNIIKLVTHYQKSFRLDYKKAPKLLFFKFFLTITKHYCDQLSTKGRTTYEALRVQDVSDTLVCVNKVMRSRRTMNTLLVIFNSCRFLSFFFFQHQLCLQFSIMIHLRFIKYRSCSFVWVFCSMRALLSHMETTSLLIKNSKL